MVIGQYWILIGLRQAYIHLIARTRTHIDYVHWQFDYVVDCYDTYVDLR